MTSVKKILNYLGLFIAGIYAGYFGAASGVLTLIFLTALSDSPFVVINAMKGLIGALANFVALMILSGTAALIGALPFLWQLASFWWLFWPKDD